MNAPFAYIAGCAHALPEKILTNEDISQSLDTSDEWIVKRTGIHRRHVAGAGETTASLGLAAAQAALNNANIKPNAIDCIITATTTPDHTFPSVATQIQAGLGITHGFAFDLQAACAGFLYAITTAEALIRAKQAQTCLIIGADTLTRISDWNDRATCVLFGDGAGAVVVSAHPSGRRGILASSLFSDGRHKDILYVDGGASTSEQVGKMRMQGKEVFRHAVTNITQSVCDVLKSARHEASDIDWFVPHQANQRIIDSVARKLAMTEDKIITTMADHANTSAASIPLALSIGVADGRVKEGDLVMLSAIGGGLAWGAMLLRW